MDWNRRHLFVFALGLFLPAADSAARTRKRKKKTTATAAKTPPKPVHQVTPSPERYREIQEALVAKGYLNSTPDGVWNQESADALRRFQADQSLEPSGKLNSLSLIALGLGPKTSGQAAPTNTAQ